MRARRDLDKNSFESKKGISVLLSGDQDNRVIQREVATKHT